MLFNKSTTSGTSGATSTGAAPTGQDAQAAITDIIKRGKTTFSAEVIPPRNGADSGAILRQIEVMKFHGADFISVTKGAGGSLRGGTLPIAQLIKTNYGICSLAHFTCRDYTVEEVENSLMDHHYFGIRNILALRGDPPDGLKDYFKPSPNRHSFAFQLVKQIHDLNRGRYLVREGYDQAQVSKGPKAHEEIGSARPQKSATEASRSGVSTDFCIGVAAYPEEEHGAEYFKLKIEAGAHFGITQMIFSAEPYGSFLEKLAHGGRQIPVIPGIRIITNLAAAQRMISKFGINIPQNLLNRLEKNPSKEDGRKVGLEYAYQLSKDLLRYGAPGIHVFIMNDEMTAGELIRLLK